MCTGVKWMFVMTIVTPEMVAFMLKTLTLTPNIQGLLEVLAHPFLQLHSDLLLPPLVNISHKHSGVKGAVVGVNPQVSDGLFPIVQETHVGCLVGTKRTKMLSYFKQRKCISLHRNITIWSKSRVLACPRCAPSHV